MIKEKYLYNGQPDDVAIISKNDKNKYNPYVVDMKICFANYESARAFIEQAGFDALKKIIRD